MTKKSQLEQLKETTKNNIIDELFDKFEKELSNTVANHNNINFHKGMVALNNAKSNFNKVE